ncbi:hypothetical protein P3719_18730 [Vibrio parahaemolyticus]|uniref:Flagellar motor protein MotB n=5 Tax=Vibrio TaxID=662 RepID=A0AA47JN70_VIBPH|nr:MULTISPECIES: hypothetical protein [Vibrio]EJG1066182.1 hypothetical protein [Vibrio parahaemolyticus O1]MDW1807603.1 hypothetical protein [Vibrio sp. Vb2362]MDW2297835.1 hypothetical protein [Vibrio sp. 1404]OOH98791.1 hypothetical protein BIW16_18440 [Vibrio sp. OULL4]APX09873.1 hypothetical protein BWP24_27045 [Vibrio campbellii]
MKINTITLCIATQLLSFTTFANDQSGQTYQDIQKQRSLSIEENKSLSQNELIRAQKEHANKMLMLDNQYQQLLIENNKLLNGGPEPKKEKASDEERLAKFQEETRTKRRAQREAEVNALLNEMEKQIFVTDIYEIAGQLKGEFWHKGAIQTLKEGESFGDWYVDSLSFQGAVVMPFDYSTHKMDKSRARHITVKTSDEAIDRFKKAQTFRDRIIEQKIGELSESSMFGAPAPTLINDSPSQGLMFK